MLQVLDTTVLIDFLRGRPAVERVAVLRSSGDIAATTAINVEEVVRGLRPRETPRETEVAQHLFRGLVVLPIDSRSGWHAGAWRRDFAERGTTLWQADCLIAATAMSNGGTLATGNPKDFPMAELRVEHWPVGQ